jgi:hypothetical protein
LGNSKTKGFTNVFILCRPSQPVKEGRGVDCVIALALGNSTKRANLENRDGMNKDEILKKVAAGELPVDQASKLLAETEQPKRGQLYCKVSEKGACSVYGLQRMPVTLYIEQWERLLNYGDEIRSFLKENEGRLKRKER